MSSNFEENPLSEMKAIPATFSQLRESCGTTEDTFLKLYQLVSTSKKNLGKKSYLIRFYPGLINLPSVSTDTCAVEETPGFFEPKMGFGLGKMYGYIFGIEDELIPPRISFLRLSLTPKPIYWNGLVLSFRPEFPEDGGDLREYDFYVGATEGGTEESAHAAANKVYDFLAERWSLFDAEVQRISPRRHVPGRQRG